MFLSPGLVVSTRNLYLLILKAGSRPSFQLKAFQVDEALDHRVTACRSLRLSILTHLETGGVL